MHTQSKRQFIDWMPCFPKEVFAQLDYVPTDATTIGLSDGRRQKTFVGNYDPGNDPESFMKTYVDWHFEILEREPLDIFSRPTWIPTRFNRDFDKLWMPERMKTVVDALKRTGTAREIDRGMRLPGLPFLQMARTLGHTRKDMFTPAPKGRKPIQIRKLQL